MNQIIKKYGRIDILFHNAVDVPLVNNHDSRITELPEEIWHKINNVWCHFDKLRTVTESGANIIAPVQLISVARNTIMMSLFAEIVEAENDLVLYYYETSPRCLYLFMLH